MPILYSGYEDGSLKIIDLRQKEGIYMNYKENQVSNSFSAHNDSVTSINVINDIYITTTGHDGYIKLWDLRTLNCINNVHVSDEFEVRLMTINSMNRFGTQFLFQACII